MNAMTPFYSSTNRLARLVDDVSKSVLCEIDYYLLTDSSLEFLRNFDHPTATSIRLTVEPALHAPRRLHE